MTNPKTEATLIFRTTTQAKSFVIATARKRGLTMTEVLRKMFKYAAQHMDEKDWTN